MQVAKWGNSLAVRLPAALVQELGLKPGDELELSPAASGTSGQLAMAVARKPTRKELVAGLRKFRGALPADYRFNREEANER